MYGRTMQTGASFSVGDVLGKGFSTYFKNLPAFLVMALVVYAPLILYGLVADPPTASSLDDLQSQALIFTGVIIGGGMLLSLVMSSAVTYTVVEELNGRHAPVGKSLLVGLTRALPTLAVGIVCAVCILLGMLALVVPGVIVMCMLYVATPASVVERPGIGGALSRSAFLTKGYRWGIFGLIIIVGVLSGIVDYVLEAVLVDSREFRGVKVINPDDWRLYVLLNVGVQAIVGALGAVMAATTYVSLRSDKDGVGVGELARVFE